MRGKGNEEGARPFGKKLAKSKARATTRKQTGTHTQADSFLGSLKTLFNSHRKVA